PLEPFALAPPGPLVLPPGLDELPPPGLDELPPLPRCGIVTEEQATPADAKMETIPTTLLLLILDSLGFDTGRGDDARCGGKLTARKPERCAQ
ncbi:MAG TPA: hypothetical protein VGC79_02260, partial [Polyangiaceae bacterium]